MDAVQDDNSDPISVINKLKKTVEHAAAMQYEERDTVLPHPVSIRRAHKLMACHAEAEIGKELQEKGAYLIPDGTSRNKVGKIGGCMMVVGNKVRALKMQNMGNEKRDNWANTIIHLLDRLATASGSEVNELYKQIKGLITDKCGVNIDLAEEISKKLGCEWVPAQLYCCIHSVLSWQEGIKEVWLSYQNKIGFEKMLPTLTGLECDINDKILVLQALDCYLRFTSIHWHDRA